MQLYSVLRLLICGEILFGIVAITLEFLLEESLPPELRSYIEENPSIFDTHTVFAAGLTLVELAALVIAWIGLWHLWNPARFIYLITLIVTYLSSLLLGPSIWTSTGAIFYDFSSLCIGGILILIFFTDLRHSFRKEKTEQGAAANR